MIKFAKIEPFAAVGKSKGLVICSYGGANSRVAFFTTVHSISEMVITPDFVSRPLMPHVHPKKDLDELAASFC